MNTDQFWVFILVQYFNLGHMLEQISWEHKFLHLIIRSKIIVREEGVEKSRIFFRFKVGVEVELWNRFRDRSESRVEPYFSQFWTRNRSWLD